MTDRLSALDVSFLYLEGRATPMHVGGLAVFQPPAAGFDYERLVALIEQRIALVPRYRQKVAWVPGHLANPVWIDDPDFDVTYHVRRSGLPRPGSEGQLLDFTARIQSRRLDRHRSLWEMYLIEGLADGRIAIATKTHHAMVDGVSALDIAQVILDSTPEPRETVEPIWSPAPVPGPVELVVDAVRDIAVRPTALLDTVRLGLSDARAAARTVGSAAGGVLSAARAALRPPPDSPLNATIGEQRRFAVARTALADYRQVHRDQAATVNDVVLATVTGALREWLLFRGEPVHATTTVRAMVPVSVRTADQSSQLGNRVSALLVDLPVGEPSPAVRLAQVGFATRAHKTSGQSIGADALVALSGFAPPTLHALGARLAGGMSRRFYNLVVTNVPGPQLPLYAAGASMLEMFPVVPLTANQALSIGVTSYDGGVYYGLNADRDAMPDVDVLATLIEESLAELVTATSGRARSKLVSVPPAKAGRTAAAHRRPTSSAAGSTRISAGRPDGVSSARNPRR